MDRDYYLARAQEYRPKLEESLTGPACRVNISRQGEKVWVEEIEGDVWPAPLGRSDQVIWDFGDHHVGYVTLSLGSTGSPQDAPAFFRLRFLERPTEALEDSADYDGWISRSWFQEEVFHVDVLPYRLALPRRYAFRYLELTVLDTSKKWKLTVEDISLRSVSSATGEVPVIDGAALLQKLGLREGEDAAKRAALLERIDKIGLRTLHSCMQDVFEDGPKRDRRLWSGDLHLQAITSYETFRNDALVLRCLYLFAGLTREDGRVSACLFTEPRPLGDDTYLFDYSLFFISILYRHFEKTGDLKVLRELLPVALRQIELLRAFFDENGLLTEEAAGRCFVDWKAGLHKQASGQAIYIYALRQALSLCRAASEEEAAQFVQGELSQKEAAALRLWDEEKGVFVSGSERQVSLASQVWMILAGVVSPSKGKDILSAVSSLSPLGMSTPYMNHFYVEALLLCGLTREAIEHVEEYWGGMAREGADTFWEIYDPDNPQESPYGSTLITSACHAWSCTPSYFFRRLLS